MTQFSKLNEMPGVAIVIGQLAVAWGRRIAVCSCWLVVLSVLSGPMSGQRCAAETVDAAGGQAADTAASVDDSSVQGQPQSEDEFVVVQPWDFDPYRILVWIDSDDPRINAQSIDAPLRAFLDRHYSAIWRVSIADAPTAVASMARRGMDQLSFDRIAASDPIIALKRDHKDAIRIRSSGDLKQYVSNIFATKGLIDSVTRRGAAAQNATLNGAAEKFTPVDGDAVAVQQKWAAEDTEALLLTRGQALTLKEPEAKLIDLPVSNLVTSSVEDYDKIFIVSIKHAETPSSVKVVEFNTLMRYFDKPVQEKFVTASQAAAAVGRGLTRAFSPELRIDDAGLKGARGLLRAGGLIVDDDSPALVREGDVLLPLVRKNDRNGRPIMIGPLDWAFLLSVRLKGEIGSVEGNNIMLELGARDGASMGSILVVTSKGKKGKSTQSRIRIEKVERESTTCSLVTGPAPKPGDSFEEDTRTSVRMEYYSGRAGGLQGRQNDRTFRRALLIRPRSDETRVRLHAKGDPEFPLIGYELYEKELYSKKMTFIGRTDWNGRLNITKTDDPLRLLYVKNGGAVLARLPIVVGYEDYASADLTGDDMRLQAEAYVNGVANAIIDLVAIRKLLGARIRNRLKKGQMKEAKELLVALRDQPTKDVLSGDLEKKQAYFLKAVGSRNANGRKKVDNMFSSTREMLDTQITQKDIRAIEEDIIRAESHGGKLPDDPVDPDAVDSSINQVPVEEPKKKKKKK